MSKRSKLSIVRGLFSRREAEVPGEASGVADTLEEIAREVRKEAAISKDVFLAPARGPKPEAALAPRKDKNAPKARSCRLTAVQYEEMFESSLTVLEQAGEIIDRNRATTAKLKMAAA